MLHRKRTRHDLGCCRLASPTITKHERWNDAGDRGGGRRRPADADEARAVTGYERYTITPFDSTRAWPVILDAAAAGRERVSVGGGAFGVNLHVAPVDLVRHLGAEVVEVSVAEVATPSEAAPGP